ncbi:MAG: PilZ domain-containing protein [Bdellovibrionales bacterium]|nr:PilZ domain-containing protein [Bdellovibrionales bacterium]
MTEVVAPGLARRRFPRRIFRRNVSLLCEGKYYIGIGNEIGEGGMLIETDQSIEMSEGATWLINFLLPSTGICIVKAEVRSSREKDGKYYYGLLFTNLDYDGKKGIREYISAKSEKESEEERRLLTANK